MKIEIDSVGRSLRNVGYEGHSTLDKEKGLRHVRRLPGGIQHRQSQRRSRQIQAQCQRRCAIHHHFRHGRFLHATRHQQARSVSPGSLQSILKNPDSISCVAMDTAVKIIQVYEANYPELLYRVFIVNGITLSFVLCITS